MPENIKKQIISLSIVAFVFLICTLIILFFINPFTASKFTVVFSYLSFSLFIITFMATVLYSFRVAFNTRRYGLANIGKHSFAISMRQSVLLCVLIVGSLILSSKGFLYWWIELTLFLTIIVLEIFFLI